MEIKKTVIKAFDKKHGDVIVYDDGKSFTVESNVYSGSFDDWFRMVVDDYVAENRVSEITAILKVGFSMIIKVLCG